MSGRVEVVVLSVKLEGGGFESSVRVPLKPGMTAADFDQHVERWLALMKHGLAAGILELNAVLPDNLAKIDAALSGEGEG
jgi:hypothetical protein